MALSDAIDWTAFWRLVDPLTPSPLVDRGFMPHLIARQKASTPRDAKRVVEDWVSDFDPTNPAYQENLDGRGRIEAGVLYRECFVPYETAIFGRNSISRDKWGKDLKKLIDAGVAPFSREDGRTTTVYVYTPTVACHS